MKRLSWPGVIVVAGSTIFSWLTSSPRLSQSGRATEATRTVEGTTREPAAASIAAMQLHDWSGKARAQARNNRDIFAFKRPLSKAVTVPAPTTGLLAASGDGRQPPLALFKLIGVAEDAGPEGMNRTAIISGQGQLYLVKEGDTVAFVYRVSRVTSESVELLDTTGGAPLRLFLK